jgi:hypothetical protein
MIVAIHAYEDNYKGYYGMCYDGLEEVKTEKEARDVARTYAENVCFDFADIYDIFVEGAIEAGLKEGTEEYGNFIYEGIEDSISYEIYEVKPYNTIVNMEIDYMINPERFIKDRCIRQL